MQAIDGNFNLAFDIMTKGTSAVKAVTEDRISFLNIVSALYDAKEEKSEERILDLSKDEKDAIDSLKADLEADIENIEANKDTILELMSNPDTAVVAHKAGLTLTDSPEEIAQKLNTFYLDNPQYNPDNISIIKGLISKYPDAGISLSDTMETAVEKLKNSPLYKQSTGLDPQAIFDLKQRGLKLDEDGNIIVDVDKASVTDIANTIKQIESNGNYNAKGASGEYGAYQFMPKTWYEWSSQYVAETFGIPVDDQTGVLDATQENQDAIAEWKIQQWLNKGYTPEQVASMWNSGSPDWEGKVGTNKQGVDYNVPKYVENFVNTLSNNVGNTFKNANPFIRVQATNFVRDHMGARSVANTELVDAVENMLLSGMSKDDIEDQLRYSGQSFDFKEWRNIAQTSFSGFKMSNIERQNQLDYLDDYISDGDYDGAVNHIKTVVLGNIGATEKKQVAGRDDALTSVITIKNLLNEYINAGGNTGLLTGKVEDFRKKVLKTTKSENLGFIANEIAVAIQKYRQDLTGAAFTESEAKEYASIFPSIGKSPKLNTALISSLKSQYERNQRKFWERQFGGVNNYDTLEKLSGVPIVDTGDLSRFNSNSGVSGNTPSGISFEVIK